MDSEDDCMVEDLEDGSTSEDESVSKAYVSQSQTVLSLEATGRYGRHYTCTKAGTRVCVRARTHTHTHIHTHERAHTHTRTHTHTCTYTHTHTHMRACV